MAYKKKADRESAEKKTPSSIDAVFKQLLSHHNKISPESAMMGDDFGPVKMYIPTGSIVYDTIIANRPNGGYPCGRIVEIYGEEAYGKSTLAFKACANAQDLGGIATYFDLEHACAQELMEACGIDFTSLIYSNLATVEEIFEAIEKNLTLISQHPDLSNKPNIIVIDSLAAMKSKKLVEGTFDYNMNTQGEFAKLLGNALKRMLPLLDKTNTCLIIINQLRDKIGCTNPENTFVTVRKEVF